MEKQHAIVPGLVTDNKDVTTIASPQQDSIIIQGTKEKKRILSDYQEKFGANYPDSIITQKKVSSVRMKCLLLVVECNLASTNGIG
jgi:hypothetical protein